MGRWNDPMVLDTGVNIGYTKFCKYERMSPSYREHICRVITDLNSVKDSLKLWYEAKLHLYTSFDNN